MSPFLDQSVHAPRFEPLEGRLLLATYAVPPDEGMRRPARRGIGGKDLLTVF